MSTTPVSATLAQTQRDEILQAITTIKEKLPFLVDLSSDDRKALPKMGDKSRAFVSKALEVATQNPEFLPRSFDLEEMRKDVQLFEALYPVLLSLTQLQELVDDTSLAVGSEAYAAALQVYNYAKASGQGAGLDGVVVEMGQRFARQPGKAKSQKTAL
ncbi:MAG: hypothetical protein V7K38_27785 [Nostoc sp.]|uniref:hypothetical protein n=1 Tax=Nostoc sp. TaxID=1180 RepID=UPI002FFACF3C